MAFEKIRTGYGTETKYTFRTGYGTGTKYTFRIGCGTGEKYKFSDAITLNGRWISYHQLDKNHSVFSFDSKRAPPNTPPPPLRSRLLKALKSKQFQILS